MSSSIEDRLAAALEAQADLVTAQDLGPIEVPHRSRRPRTSTVLLLAAAACAAVVATPFVIRAVDGSSPSPGPSGTPTAGVTEPSPSDPTQSGPTQSGPTSSESTESDPSTDVRGITLADPQRADVDGDGRPDDVRLMLGSTRDGLDGGSVDVTLAAGGTSSTELPVGYLSDQLLPAYDINGDGHDQVLLKLSGGDESSLLVYTWYDGSLVLAKTPRSAPLAVGSEDEHGLMYNYFFDDGLFSWLRQDPVDPAGATYHVKEWSWSVHGDQLVPTSVGQRCLDVTTQDAPQQC
jgi:hypothetical protein